MAAGPPPTRGLTSAHRDGASDPVRAHLEELLAEARSRAEEDADLTALWDELDRTVHGGKRFRGRLVLGAHAALGGQHPQAAVVVAAAFEMLHAAFLVHDDLIDHDTVRRGGPNLMAVMLQVATDRGLSSERAAQFAEAAAVLAGDLALGLAHECLAAAPAPASVRPALQALFGRMLAVSVRGELADVRGALDPHGVDVAGALETAAAKTAMYSFQAPLQAGALLAAADTEVLGALDEVGLHLGTAFQLADDLSGVFAPQEVTGKSALSDLREGKATTLMLLARTLPVWSSVSTHVGRPDLAEDEAVTVRRALARSTATTQVLDRGHAEISAALTQASEGPLPGPARRLVVDLAGTVRAELDKAAAFVAEARGVTEDRVPGTAQR
ncbi:polyprenyl synthetase family protein [Georgenia sp. 10Sc9-8]|uniref:Polyprenyl synthetase family protein n=1 Tax=Georgenia halotolerans TaxID=3028317 RepID=A0ABT5TWM9_9MICO|nr:polyprenyl synthetase family protein [Georgenia halotolerans]